MNAVEIEEAVSTLAKAPFDPREFPFQFLEAFDFAATTVKKLRAGKGPNKSDVPGGFLPGRQKIHLAVCPPGETTPTLQALLASEATAKQKAKFVLATDGVLVEAKNLADDAEPPLVCDFAKLDDHFGYFLALAGISTVKAIRENAFDIKATGRLNRLYVELIRHNPGLDADAKREQLNHFFARLIFCFFAEDTGIFHGDGLFTATIQQMSDPDGSNTAFVLAELFRAMDLPIEKRDAANLKSWAENFPYVNGGLFGGAGAGDDVPRFSKIARSYLLHVGSLDWTKINPDIFGSMIQAVADDAERGALGMHYTSVPNILKVLNPLFLDDLRAKLADAGDNARKLFNLRDRLAHIRVFDPACGSGNFLVIAYKELRAIEAEINRRRREPHADSEIPLTNFRGIEIRHFAVEVARLALVIAEYQCNALYMGEQRAKLVFLPLNQDNWITHGNALRLDWQSVCPPCGTGVKLVGDDLFSTLLDQPVIDFDNAGGETYICGNPPYLGFTWQTKEQKEELRNIFGGRTSKWKSLDYVGAWFMKAADYGTVTKTSAAFVATNSICQGEQVPILWPLILSTGHKIGFAHTSFHWANLASYNAGVTVAIISITQDDSLSRTLYSVDETGGVISKTVSEINPYLVPGPNIIVQPLSKPLGEKALLVWGNKPTDGGNLILSTTERNRLEQNNPSSNQFLRPYIGSAELIRGLQRYCVWIENDTAEVAATIPAIRARIEGVHNFRASSTAAETRSAAVFPHRFRQIQATARRHSLILPQVSSERREYLQVGLLPAPVIVSNLAFALYDAPIWNLALIASKLHLVWIATVCGKLKTDYRYSNTLGWNTFPVPPLSEQNKADLTRHAEDILLARESYWPATIADLYDPDDMDSKYPDLRAAHERNDETLERIYIGRRFKNDTERLEKLFQMYTQMTQRDGTKPRKGKS